MLLKVGKDISDRWYRAELIDSILNRTILRFQKAAQFTWGQSIYAVINILFQNERKEFLLSRGIGNGDDLTSLVCPLGPFMHFECIGNIFQDIQQIAFVC